MKAVKFWHCRGAVPEKQTHGSLLQFLTNCVDAYQDITIPFQMSSVEFFELVKEHLTDDKAPVELLGMKVIDELIKEEVTYYRKVYKEGGLKALLEKL